MTANVFYIGDDRNPFAAIWSAHCPACKWVSEKKVPEKTALAQARDHRCKA